MGKHLVAHVLRKQNEGSTQTLLQLFNNPSYVHSPQSRPKQESLVIIFFKHIYGKIPPFSPIQSTRSCSFISNKIHMVFVWLVTNKKINTNLLQLRSPHESLSLNPYTMCIKSGESVTISQKLMECILFVRQCGQSIEGGC